MAHNVPGDAQHTSDRAAADPVLITSLELARRLGVSPSWLWKLRRERSPEGQRLRACIFRATAKSTWWSVPKLRTAGFLLPAQAPVARATDPAADVIAWRIGGGL